MSIRIAINGFGRIGRNVLRAGYKNTDIEWVAINDLTDAKTLAHLLKYDSTFGIMDAEVKADGNAVVVNGKKIQILSEKDPAALPWKNLKVDLVIESTGKFTNKEGASKHLAAGAKKVLISAPAKDAIDATIVMGVNDETYDKNKHHIVSNASCTTNCLAPIAKVLNDKFKIKRGLMTTIHSYTNDQVILDFPHKDLRRARAAGLSIIPTSTGAAKAIGLVIPELAGKMNGLAVRVPTPNVSVVDLVCDVEKEATAETINAAYKEASSGALKGILQYCDEPLVSKDFYANPHSAIFDAGSTYVVDKTMVKVFGWYDNEWAYSVRMIDLAKLMLK
ncbi:MAG: type I glyceraldehyde-3-phosphate dehydrogenase [Candidatus Ratteibacteria bacterium]|nr:type I glyceraldehyde-3-phosphate dehydrogenase [Candidatus Ratteibacteria bacterium]